MDNRLPQEIINEICSDCIIFPMCSTICENYFEAANNVFYANGLNRRNWLRASKSTCDLAFKFLWNSRDYLKDE